jgi:hypothetical protein
MHLDSQPREGRIETIYTPSGQALEMFTSLPRPALYGDKEFPHSLGGSALVTKQHNGEKLTADEQKALAGYRQYPNSDLMGNWAGLERQGKLTPEMAVAFMQAKREAGCLKPGKVHNDGSLEFQ